MAMAKALDDLAFMDIDFCRRIAGIGIYSLKNLLFPSIEIPGADNEY